VPAWIIGEIRAGRKDPPAVRFEER